MDKTGKDAQHQPEALTGRCAREFLEGQNFGVGPVECAEMNGQVSKEALKGFNIFDQGPTLQERSTFIENSKVVYIPLRLECGVIAQCRPDVLARCPSVLRYLNDDIKGCLQVLPRSVHALVKRTNIWVNTTYFYGPRHKPFNANHSTAHHHEAWLVLVQDRPEKACSIEIYNCFDYLKMRLHWNGFGLLLHEMCHLIHQLTLPDGLENPSVIEAYERAELSGRYERVLRRDWAGMDCDSDMAYAMVNFKEFFAEISVTFLSDAYHELDCAQGESMHSSSPVLVAPAVVERVNIRNQIIKEPFIGLPTRHEDSSTNSRSRPSPPQIQRSGAKHPPIREKTMHPFPFFHSIKCAKHRQQSPGILAHCNKFYPFTRGQLRQHDPATFDSFVEFWSIIEEWEDEDDLSGCCYFRLWRRH